MSNEDYCPRCNREWQTVNERSRSDGATVTERFCSCGQREHQVSKPPAAERDGSYHTK